MNNYIEYSKEVEKALKNNLPIVEILLIILLIRLMERRLFPQQVISQI